MLTASLGSWSGTPALSLSDQWQRCNATGGSCAAISGATASTYTLGSADVGSTIAVVVTAVNSAGTATADSTPTAVVTSAAGPVTALLDTFNRPNNGGPPGPNWSHMLVGSTSA